MSVEHIDKSTAAAALRSAAVRYDDPDHDAFGRTLIHCMMSFTGADWDLDDALHLLSKATEVAWVDHLAGHELGIFAHGKCHYFNARRPRDEVAGA